MHNFALGGVERHLPCLHPIHVLMQEVSLVKKLGIVCKFEDSVN